MAFVQIIDMHTSRFDEINALEDEWRSATEGKRTLRRSIVARDRNDPEHYVVLAFFDSYESAMTNSNLPETSESAGSRPRSSAVRWSSPTSKSSRTAPDDDTGCDRSRRRVTGWTCSPERPSNGTGHRALGGRRGADDHDRTGGMLHDLLAHRTQEQPLEAAAAA